MVVAPLSGTTTEPLAMVVPRMERLPLNVYDPPTVPRGKARRIPPASEASVDPLITGPSEMEADPPMAIGAVEVARASDAPREVR